MKNKWVALIAGSAMILSRMAGAAGLEAPQAAAISQRSSPSAEIKELIQGLRGQSSTEQVTAAEQLGELGPRAAPAVPALIGMLRNQGMESVMVGDQRIAGFNLTSEAAANALAKIGKPALEPLRAALLKPGASEDQVFWRARALARMKHLAATDILLGTLKQPAFRFRGKLAEALGDCPDTRALAPLLLLAKDKDLTIRRGAVAGLARRKELKAIEALVAALRDPDKEVRNRAAAGLRNAADPSTLSALVGALKDPYDNVRNLSAQALGAIRDGHAVGPLVELVGADPAELVRFQAGRALEAITGEDFGEDGARWRAWWEKQKEKD